MSYTVVIGHVSNKAWIRLVMCPIKHGEGSCFHLWPTKDLKIEPMTRHRCLGGSISRYKASLLSRD